MNPYKDYHPKNPKKYAIIPNSGRENVGL